MSEERQTRGPSPDRPWLMRTYSGHSSAEASNALYRANLERGQTGLSVAFDLPTQTGHDADDPVAAGEVGKVGVPIAHMGDMERLFQGIPLAEMNTSMTINATAPWILALYQVVAERQGAEAASLRGTTQNDLIKEFLSRGTYMLPPQHSITLQTDLIAYCAEHMPRWNPINICSYHLQEAGATPTLEVAYALANAMNVLDGVRARADMSNANFPRVVGSFSFFVNAGIRFIEEMVKLRVMTRLWDRITLERYGVEDPKLRRFRYGVQVNSLGLTEQQPENNAYRIAIEALGVVLSKNARARAVQLPAWNEALGLPRDWDQQWSLRLQQILAYETDLLEYGDLFEGSHEVARLERELEDNVQLELSWIADQGGVLEAVRSGSMKEKLVQANAARMARIERGEQVVVGVNRFTEAVPSPLVADADKAILKVDDSIETEQRAQLEAWRTARNDDDVATSLAALRDAAQLGNAIMEPTLRCALAGVTTGEWGACMRAIFGAYRAPTGVAATIQTSPGPAEGETRSDLTTMESSRAAVDEASQTLGRRLKLLVAKPGLDGHSNGAEQVAMRARDAGMEVVYEGIRLTTDEIIAACEEEGVHAVGVSILSGSHMVLVPAIIDGLQKRGLEDIAVVVGGIIPESDRQALMDQGVDRVFTPSDFDLNRLMVEIADAVVSRQGAGA